MPTITSTGVGSGLDVSGLVEKLVAAEGEPVRIRLDRKEAELQQGLTALGTFKGAVSGFQQSLTDLANPETFRSIDVENDNEEALTAVSGKDALPGEYEVEIVQLAQAQKLASDAFDSDVKPLGRGKLMIQLGRFDADSGRFSSNADIPPVMIEITDANSSLRGIRQAINDAAEGVRASVINDGSGQRLVLSSLVEGSASSIRVQVSDSDASDTDLFGLSVLAFDPATTKGNGINMVQTVAAQDAIVRVDGLQVSRSGNQIDDVIEGINLELQPGSVGSKVRLSVALNTGHAVSLIEEFVASYNELIDTVNTLTAYDTETQTAGPLSGDASVRGVMAQIRRMLASNFSSVNDTYDSLSSIGIDTQRDGKLSIDNSKLRQVVDTDLQQLVQLFAVSGSTSDPLVNYRGAGSDTQPGAYDLEITQLATQGQFRGGLTNVGKFSLQQDESRLRLRVDGRLSDLMQLKAGEYSGAADLKGELQEALHNDQSLLKADINVKVAIKDGRLVFMSEKYGEGSAIEIVSIDPELAVVSGLTLGEGIRGQNVGGRFNNHPASGAGRILTAQGVALELKVEVIGGMHGKRGQVFFANGVAAQLNTMLESFNQHGSLFDSRKQGFNNRINDITRQREKLSEKLQRTEQRLTRQFSSLDSLLGKMRNTGAFLDRQLAALPGAKGRGNK